MRRIILITFCCVGGIIYAQKIVKPKSDRWLRREAFKNIDHFFIGFHIGIGIPLSWGEFRKSTTDEIYPYANFAFAFTPAPPPFRLNAGYKWKRHMFDVSAETKVGVTRLYDYDPYGGNLFPLVSSYLYFSVGYNIDLLSNKNSIKLNTGINLGVFYSPWVFNSASPGVGINFMIEFPINQIVSLYMDPRFTLGLVSMGEEYNYSSSSTITYRPMCLDFNLGLRFNMYSKAKYKEGMNNM